MSNVRNSRSIDIKTDLYGFKRLSLNVSCIGYSSTGSKAYFIIPALRYHGSEVKKWYLTLVSCIVML